MAENVVITGMGIVSPIGCGETAFWDALIKGKSGAGPVTGFPTDGLSRTIACQVRDTIEVEGDMGRASKLAVVAAKEAFESAGLTPLNPPLVRGEE